MLTEPKDLDQAALRELLEGCWDLRVVELKYLPVGFGSHHWRVVDPHGTQSFVTADDLQAGFQAGSDTDSAFAALDRAFRTAAALQAELNFVVAPLADKDGEVTRRLSSRYAVTVSPFLEGQTSSEGVYKSEAERRQIAQLLGRLHTATDHVPAGLPRREEFAIPARSALLEALEELDQPWSSGPFGEGARELLSGSAFGIKRCLAEYDELAAKLRQTSDSWVITHGEPHRANVIRDPEGRLLLIDWDTTLVAPRERDLRHVLDDDLTGWEEYTEAVPGASLDREALRLYRFWWDLTEICLYTDLFRRPHEHTEDTAASWEELQDYLPIRT